PPKPKVEISIVANPRQNSIIVRAPVDRIAIAEQFINRIDVASDSMLSLADLEARFKIYVLKTFDPAKLIEILGEMNILEPSTRIRVDKDRNALIVSGSPADRFVIESLIERLDGAGRSFHVLQLRRLEANEVAESITFLMGKKEDDDKQSSSRRYYYYGYGNDDDDDKGDEDEFRVAANTRYRQVLLWANESEMKQVENLLIQLGELPPPGGSKSVRRVVDAAASPETYQYLKRLQEEWSQYSSTPLEIPDADNFKEPVVEKVEKTGPTSSDVQELDEEEGDEEKKAPSDSKSTTEDKLAVRGEAKRASQATTLTAAPADDDGEESNPAEAQIRSLKEFKARFEKPEPKKTPAKLDGAIQISLDANGNLVLRSDDTEALDKLEGLMMQVAPPRKEYELFQIQHASATFIKMDLEDFFDQEEDSGDDGDSFFRWYYGYDDDSGDDDKPTGLGQGNQLKFVTNIETNTLIVSGATNQQMRSIRELIKLWDVPEEVDTRSMRFAKLTKIRYGKADKIAETVKDAFRDLLSSNDKAFQQRKPQGKGEQGERSKKESSGGSGLADSSSGRDSGDADFSFKGKLSMGVDEVGNTLLVSAEGESLLNLVIGMIEQLDNAAMPSGEVQVLRLSGDLSGDSLRDALKSFGASGVGVTTSGGGAASAKPAPPSAPAPVVQP
ncbi:MAG: secretin N-terminal domain-containing protein, partial [Planctomycetota bacterium]